jgi:YbgC/YbaW family acyl-CoA thioester hydrolase
MLRAPPFRHTVRPRYSEVDMQKVVFNGHWLDYFDDASTRFFESLGFDPRDFVQGKGFDVMVVKAVLEWKSPATFDDLVVIEVTCDRVGTKSFDLRYAASIDCRPVCIGVVTYVSINPGTKESTAVPEALRTKLEGARTA